MVSEQFNHQAVMTKEVIDSLSIKPDGFYVDATYGRGGHTQALLSHLDQAGRVLLIDQDPQAIADAKKKYHHDPRVIIHHGSFATLFEVVTRLKHVEKISGILLDLGVSSPQLEDASRGFSFLREGPLDMRMDPAQPVSATEWINHASESEIAEVLKVYGEERFSKRIARAIVNDRTTTPFETTTQLAHLIARVNPSREKHKHPATRSFQAIRIFINQELQALSQCLESCLEVLAVGGRLAVISFHSLEDRIVKRWMRKLARGADVPREIPFSPAFQPRLRIIGRALKPGREEIQHNPRARSALLRIAEKIV